MNNTINQLGNLEQIIQMGILDKFFRKNKDGKVDRREFLKGTGKLAGIAAATQIPSIMVPDEAEAKLGLPDGMGKADQNKTLWVSSRKDSIVNGLIKELPTILHSLIEDPLMEKIPGIPPGINLAGEIYERAWLVRDDPKKLVEFIPKFNYKTEPASYLIAGYLYKNPEELATAKKFGNLPKNHSMTHWAKEIGMYLNKYLRRENVRDAQIEEPAYRAMIISSGGQSINKMTTKGVDLNKVTDMKTLIWATTWLIDHLNPKKNYKQLYTNIEMPIRNKSQKLKIRGKYI